MPLITDSEPCCEKVEIARVWFRNTLAICPHHEYLQNEDTYTAKLSLNPTLCYIGVDVRGTKSDSQELKHATNGKYEILISAEDNLTSQ